MPLHDFDILVYLDLGILTLAIGLLILRLIKTNSLLIKRSYVVLLVLILTASLGLSFDIEWNFEGENKDGVITGKALFALLILTNFLNLILLLLFAGLERIVWRRSKAI